MNGISRRVLLLVAFILASWLLGACVANLPTPARTPYPTQYPTSEPYLTPIGGGSAAGGGGNPDGQGEAIARIVQNAVNAFEPGWGLFNPPTEMKVNHTEKIEVRISREELQPPEFNQELDGPGAPIIEPLDAVSPFMAVELIGDPEAFQIIPLSTREQFVKEKRHTEWAWNVKPLQSGQRALTLKITNRIKINVDKEEWIDYETETKVIDVQVNLPLSVRRFVAGNWEWIFGTIGSIFTTIAGWRVWKTLRVRKGAG